MSQKTLRCIVEGCQAKSSKNCTIFPFPKCSQTQQLWRKALVIHPDEDIREHKGVCSLHFEDGYLVRDESQQIWLMPGAVPDLFPESLRSLPSYSAGSQCRMCGAKQKTALTNKVSVLRQDLDLLPVLDICLDLKSVTHRHLPDGVCEACTSMVRFIARFTRTCWKAQNTLSEQHAPGKGRPMEPWRRIWMYPDEAKTTVETEAESIQEAPESVVEQPSVSRKVVTKIEPVEAIPSIVKQEPQSEGDVEEEQIFTMELAAPGILEPKHGNNATTNSSPRSKPAKADSAGPPASKKHRYSDPTAENYLCDFCVQKFPTKRLLDQHIRTHVRNLYDTEKKRIINIEQFRCLRCREKFPTADQLKQHFSQTHKDKIECRNCNITFKVDTQLEKHMAKMHPSRVITKAITKTEPVGN